MWLSQQQEQVTMICKAALSKEIQLYDSAIQ